MHNSFIKEEFKKFFSEKLLLISTLLILFIINIFTLLLYKFADINEYSYANDFEKICVIYICIVGLLSFAISSIINYFIISKEYINNTWELILTKKFKQLDICKYKYIASIVYYIISMTLSTLLFIIICKFILSLNINFSQIFNIFLVLLFVNMMPFTIQFIIQLRHKNINISVLSIIIFTILPLIVNDTLFFKYITCYSFLYIATLSISNLNSIIIYSIINFILSIILLNVFGKRFYK